MAPARTDLVLTPASCELLGCLEDALAEFHDEADRPRNVHLRTGSQAEPLWATTRDECCEGLAWVRVVTWYPTTAFPEQQTAYNRCAVLLWVLVLEMGVARCAPMADASQLPSAAEWEAVTRLVNADAAAMQRAVCCFRDADPDRMWIPAPWAPIATEGGCVGGTTQLTIAVPPCACTELEEMS